MPAQGYVDGSREVLCPVALPVFRGLDPGTATIDVPDAAATMLTHL